ncbi:hypothetical protein E3A20_28890, partial [Planctomyces bekefii]
LTDGVIAGVGAVLVFLPQICLLFLFIGLLEDCGYMARSAGIVYTGRPSGQTAARNAPRKPSSPSSTSPPRL